MEKTTYVVVSAGYWAADKELKLAVMHLLSMGNVNAHKKIWVYHVSDDWELSDFGIKATTLQKLTENMVVPAKLITTFNDACNKIEDVTDDVLIAAEKDEAA